MHRMKHVSVSTNKRTHVENIKFIDATLEILSLSCIFDSHNYLPVLLFFDYPNSKISFLLEKCTCQVK